jgi:hypothetical protein
MGVIRVYAILVISALPCAFYGIIISLLVTHNIRNLIGSVGLYLVILIILKINKEVKEEAESIFEELKDRVRKMK